MTSELIKSKHVLSADCLHPHSFLTNWEMWDSCAHTDGCQLASALQLWPSFISKYIIISFKFITPMAFECNPYNPSMTSLIRLTISGVVNSNSVTKSSVKGQDVGVTAAAVCPSWAIYEAGSLLRQAWHALNPAWRRDALWRLAGASPRRQATPPPPNPTSTSISPSSPDTLHP